MAGKGGGGGSAPRFSPRSGRANGMETRSMNRWIVDRSNRNHDFVVHHENPQKTGLLIELPVSLSPSLDAWRAVAINLAGLETRYLSYPLRGVTENKSPWGRRRDGHEIQLAAHTSIQYCPLLPLPLLRLISLNVSRGGVARFDLRVPRLTGKLTDRPKSSLT